MKPLFALLALGAGLSALAAADRVSVGLAADGQTIQATLPTDSSGATRVLLIGGLDGTNTLAPLLSKEKPNRKLSLTVIPQANPAKSTLVFPPTGDAYREHSESHALWRFIATTGPDLIVIAGADPANLAAALQAHSPANVAKVPVQSVAAKPGLLRALKNLPGPSPLHTELDRRAQRTPKQVAELLAKPYGHDMNEAVYIPAFALIAQLRLGHLAAVEKIVAPYVNGTKKSLEKPSSSHFSGHLLFADLAQRTKNPRYIQLVRDAANFGFTTTGEMKESMPLHSQMSDSVFMGSPILVQAGQLTGEARYYDMAVKHFRFMRQLDLRPDGLWRHSPLDEAAWGRGNAFALLGMALTLDALPKDHPGFDEILRDYQNHAAALAKQQDTYGMWRQIVDHSGTYRELSATAMIARALLIGVRRNWLDRAAYQPRIDHAWMAVSIRTSDTGELIDVCESTGAQKTLADYLKRKAILGVDPRGGAMVMLFATEMAGLNQ